MEEYFQIIPIKSFIHEKRFAYTGLFSEIILLHLSTYEQIKLEMLPVILQPIGKKLSEEEFYDLGRISLKDRIALFLRAICERLGKTKISRRHSGAGGFSCEVLVTLRKRERPHS